MSELIEHVGGFSMDRLASEADICGISLSGCQTRQEAVDAICQALASPEGLARYLNHLDYRCSILFHKIVEQETYEPSGQEETDLLYMGSLCIAREGSQVHVVKEVKEMYSSAIRRKEIACDPEWVDTCVYYCGLLYGVYSIGTLTRYLQYENKEITNRETRILCDMRQDVLHADGYLVAIDLKGKDYSRWMKLAKTIPPCIVEKEIVQDIRDKGYPSGMAEFGKLVSYLKEHKVKPKEINGRMRRIHEKICRNGTISLSDDLFRSDYEIALNVPTDQVQLHDVLNYVLFNARQRSSYGHRFHEYPSITLGMQKSMIHAIKVNDPMGMATAYRMFLDEFRDAYVIKEMCFRAYDAFDGDALDRKKAYSLLQNHLYEGKYEKEMNDFYQVFLGYNKAGLMKLMQEAGIEADEKMKKKTMASLLANTILQPEVMHRIFERYGAVAYDLMEDVCIHGETRYSIYVHDVPELFLGLYFYRSNLAIGATGVVKEAYMNMKEKYHIAYRRKKKFWE